jgi:flagellar hook-associated protein 3 FlgL
VQAIADSLTVELDTISKRAKLANDLGQALYSMDQALEHVQTKRTSVGNRMQTLDTRVGENADTKLRIEEQVSELQDLDFAEAVSRLNLQSVALQAAQQAYVKIQGLSLFNYLR